MNRHIATEIVTPINSKGRPFPSRVQFRFEGKDGQVVLDQIRTVGKVRLVRRLGRLNRQTQEAVLGVLAELFAG